MAAVTRALLLLAALCLPALANIPQASYVAAKPHPGGGDFAPVPHQAATAANALSVTGFARCLCDEGRRSRSTGKERDAETGLDYFGARYLSAAQGRFTSPDAPFADQHPGSPQSWNLYSYGRNNPLAYVDPSGRCVRLADSNGSASYSDANSGGQLIFEGACANGVIDDASNPSPSLLTSDEQNASVLRQIGLNLSGSSVAEVAFNGANGAAFVLSLPGMATGFVQLIRGPGLIQLELQGAAQAANAATAAEGVTGAASAANAARMRNSLASEQQMGEVLGGQAGAIAGPGTGSTLRDAPRLAAQYGGKAEDWVKIRSSNYQPRGGGEHFEIHAYRNTKTGQVVEMKTKFQ